MVFPCRIYAGTESGRQYLLGCHCASKKPAFYRVDNILNVKMGVVEAQADAYHSLCEQTGRYLWGVSLRKGESMDHIEMTLRVEDGEYFISDRLEREKRCGTVERIDAHTLRFSADVYDAGEMLPWLRTFTGRIISLTCTDPAVTEKFRCDLDELARMYGGEADVS